jgi:membrane fusion protein (multidrug efflux system)
MGAAMLSACGSGQPPGDAEAGVPKVGVITLRSRPVTLTRELPGRARALLIAEVRPQVSGVVKRLLFTEGSYVKAGQPLYELDDAIYRAQYESAQAALRKAQATLHVAQLAARRSRDLIGIDAVSAQDNENALAAESQAQADLGVAQAAVDSSRVNLAYAHIVAPIGGRIGKSMVTQGALVTANQAEPMASIQQLDPIYVEVNQSSNDWLSMKQAIETGRLHAESGGAKVKIQLGNGTAYAHDGKLQFSDVTVDPSTGNFLLRAVVPNPDQLLLPGMYVRATIDEGSMSGALLVPQQGISRDAKGDGNALVVGKDNKVELRTVHVSRTIGDQWLVDDGLSVGDRVIVEGSQKAAPGTQVQALEHGGGEPMTASR